VRVVEVLFRWLAALRRARAFHPKGTTYEGRGTFDGVEGPIVARLSRGAGFPDRIPDFHGVAVRWLDRRGPGRHQDVLLTSVVGPQRGLRHVLRPTRRFEGATFTSVAPHRGSMLRAEAAAGGMELTFLVARTFGRRWRPLATATLERRSDAVVRFDPWNTAPAFEPRNLVHALRRPAYAGSRRGAES
jgi:hypothetical protein